MLRKQIHKNPIQLVYFNYYKGTLAKELSKMFSIKHRAIYNKLNTMEKKITWNYSTPVKTTNKKT